ncbi:S9 family peptidase [Mucilaginibacter lappiensis]|uniref:Dipeptidyl aminopeptidase/acylaminoacyl peptidase n=1 Tax=Mucilaginibacter lappiensis TaxID=354630 RepID=A0A841JS75_9SPHI|nr:S9 family peptidase [Mucilaginibacter lappiensis]MBB6131638.1 dipeptidyl aminopeptidase/acylaminoacyl peptidase [Mucilaginibacter lappiensis]
MKPIQKHALIVALLCIAGNVYSQTKSDSLPGNKALPSSKEDLLKIARAETGTFAYSVEDYFSKPKQSAFKISDDGNYFSYREKDGFGKRYIYIKDIKTGKTSKVVSEGNDLISDYGWINKKRLFYLQDKGGNENFQLYAVDIDGKNNLPLTPFKDVKVSSIQTLKEQPDYLIIQMNKDNPQVFEPYKININTGLLVKLYNNKDAKNPVTGYDFDKDGRLRAYTQQENGTESVLYYRANEAARFNQVIKTTWKDNFSIIDFAYDTPYAHDAYVLTNLESNTAEIVLYDLLNKKIIKRIYKNDVFDVDGMGVSRKRNYETDYYFFTGEKTQIVPVSETFKKLYQEVEAKFRNYQFNIVGQTTNEDKFLLYVSSDKLYGKYYLYDAVKDEFKLLLDVMPNLKEEDMAEMRPIQFSSRDGLKLYGYLTIPKKALNGEKVPLIMNPHGGPYGVRDEWGFNPETQLFASRGYATLQINYRGSGGYGKIFSLAGNKQIGRKMLEDLEDGLAYAKTLGFIDEKRIAIYGGSYGGLATLGSLVKTPDLYTCGIDYCGVSNLFTFFKAFPPYWKPFLGQVYEQWYNPDNQEDQKIMTLVSPALNIDQIKKPLLVAQGANDPRVNINESDQMVAQLRNKGLAVPYLVKYNEGHGFQHEENRIELYKTMMGFFALHLK